MADLKTSIILDLAGNLASRARQFEGSLNRLGAGGSRSMQLMQRSAAAAGRGLDSLGNRYTALITGAAGVGAVRQVAALEMRFARLGNQANRSTEDMDSLKKLIFKTAMAPDIRVDPSQITSAIEEIIDKTGDLKYAEANIRTIGLAIQATGAEGVSIGGIMAEFQKMGLDAKDSFLALEALTAQGKEGAFTLQNLAAQGPRVVTAYTAMGRSGADAVREMGAALQVIRQGTGSSEMATTAFEALLRTMGDASKVKMLQAGGIQVFDPEQAKLGKEVLRPINELMVEIVRRTGGKKTVLSKVFDAEAIRAFNAASAEFLRTGQIESLEKFYNVQSDGTVLTKDAARAAATLSANLTSLYTAWQQFADSELTKPIQDLTEWLDGLKPGTVERWLRIAKYVAMIGAGAIVARKMFNVGSMISGAMRGRGGAPGGGIAGGAGGLLGGRGPIPVYVVNSRMSLLNPMGGPGGVRGGGPAGKAAGALLKYLPIIAAGKVAGAAAGGYALGTAANHGLGWLSGKIFGDEYGGEGWLGNMIYDAVNGRQDKMSVGGELKISIDSEGRASVREMRGDNLDLEVNTGRVMVSR